MRDFPPIAAFVPVALMAALLSPAVSAFTAEEIEALSPVSPLPVAVDLAAVVANGSTVFTVSTHGVAALSQDAGITWSKAPRIPAAPTDTFSGLATDGSRYVALRFGVTLHSTDLQTWTVSSNTAGQYEILHAQDMFVSCGTHSAVNHAIRISSDGDVWSNPASVPEDVPTMRSIAYGGGVFVAGGDDGTLIRSTDGQTWTTVFSGIPGRTGAENRFQHVSYANSLFLATGWDALLYTSPDGETWTERTPDTTHNLEKVTYMAGRYVFANTLSDTFITTDLETFERVGIGVTGSTDHFAHAGGLLLSVGRDGYIGTTEDGTAWTERRVRLGDNFSSVAAAEGVFVTIDRNESNYYSSEDGLVWTLRLTGDDNPRTSVVHGNGRFLVLGNSSANYSDDGISWTEGPDSLDFNPDSLHFANGRFIALGRSGELAESTDGLAWTSRETGSTNWLYNIAYGEGIYAVTQNTNVLLTSPDLTTWDEVTLVADTSQAYRGVAYGDGRFIVASRFTDFVTSEDGMVWTVDSESASYHLSTFGYDAEYGFYIHGTETLSRQLPNGGELSSWTTNRFPANSPLSGVAKLGEVVVGVGNNVLLSTAANTVGYNEWVLENFPGESDPLIIGEEADPDMDDRSNLEEYARGTDPNGYTDALPTELTRGESDAELSWTHPSPPEDVVIAAEYSTGLDSWSDADLELVTSDNGDGTIDYLARVTGTASSGPRLFIRIVWSRVN